jgi:hypothetical protein
MLVVIAPFSRLKTRGAVESVGDCWKEKGSSIVISMWDISIESEALRQALDRGFQIEVAG